MCSSYFIEMCKENVAWRFHVGRGGGHPGGSSWCTITRPVVTWVCRPCGVSGVSVLSSVRAGPVGSVVFLSSLPSEPALWGQWHFCALFRQNLRFVLCSEWVFCSWTWYGYHHMGVVRKCCYIEEFFFFLNVNTFHYIKLKKIIFFNVTTDLIRRESEKLSN